MQRLCSDSKDVLGQVEKHQSERYFILKSTVLSNLYGVDIEEVAVEICKLSLFLKLVAKLESYDQIEPLPDIDFNIRAGNTLLGFDIPGGPAPGHARLPLTGRAAKYSRRSRQPTTASRRTHRGVDWMAHEFRRQQTMLGEEVTVADKPALRDRLRSLLDELDCYLAPRVRRRTQQDRCLR